MSVRCVRGSVIAPRRERLEGIGGQIRLAGSLVLRVMGWGAEGCVILPFQFSLPRIAPHRDSHPLSTPHAQA